MYDVKQFVPEEWSSPPLEARLVEKPGLGTVCMGRGAINSEGAAECVPERAHGVQGGWQEAAGEPGAGLRGRRGDRIAALRRDRHQARTCCRRCRSRVGVFMPDAQPGARRRAWRSTSARRASWSSSWCRRGEKWGRGPEARRALEPRSAGRLAPPGIWCRRSTRWSKTTATRRRSRASSTRCARCPPAQKKMVEATMPPSAESDARRQALGVDHWVHDRVWDDSLVRL